MSGTALWERDGTPVPQELPDVAATEALGARLAALLRPGDLLVLTGPLGAGKTALTRGLGRALGVRGSITSPTFVLARDHRGPLPLLHVDAYRLRDSAAAGPGLLDDLDLESALEVGVVVVEWGEGLVEDLAPSRLHVVLDRSGAGRTAHVRPVGPRWLARDASRQDTVRTRHVPGPGPARTVRFDRDARDGEHPLASHRLETGQGSG